MPRRDSERPVRLVEPPRFDFSDELEESGPVQSLPLQEEDCQVRVKREMRPLG